MWCSRSTIKLAWLCACVTQLLGCRSGTKKEDTVDDILHGTISYPFYETKPLGINRSTEKFVIRTTTGPTEYVVEIPGAAEDYDIEVPLAAMSNDPLLGGKSKASVNPVATDREATENFPSMGDDDPVKTGTIDKAFGVGKADGPAQAPSYTLGLDQITQLYRQKRYEYALIEIDHMLSFYPNSPKLHKMKGTVFVKLQEWNLAEKAWTKALELTPTDAVLKKGIERLQKKNRRLSEER